MRAETERAAETTDASPWSQPLGIWVLNGAGHGLALVRCAGRSERVQAV
jgi:hypothetical protein